MFIRLGVESKVGEKVEHADFCGSDKVFARSSEASKDRNSLAAQPMGPAGFNSINGQTVLTGSSSSRLYDRAFSSQSWRRIRDAHIQGGAAFGVDNHFDAVT
ncbi:MAG: hypothetical protein U5N55_14180 [Cypionkella sp.]|nr:hypothetical protein [Cypionkella sp.]